MGDMMDAIEEAKENVWTLEEEIPRKVHNFFDDVGTIT